MRTPMKKITDDTVRKLEKKAKEAKKEKYVLKLLCRLGGS